MNNLLNIHQNIAKAKTSLPLYLTAINENQIYQNKPANVVEPVVNLITKLLNIQDNFNEGLQYLDCYLNQYSEDVLEAKGIYWVQCLSEKLNNPGKFSDVALIYGVLGKLLVISAQSRDLNKTIEEKLVQVIIESILNSSSRNFESLKCLEICLKLFGGKSGQYKNKIESFCFSFLDLNEDLFVEQAAKCLHYLQQTRGGGTSGGIHKKCWTEFHSQIIGSLEQLHSQIFKNVVEVEVNTGKSERLKLEDLKLSPEPVTKFATLLIRYKNVCKVLEVALLEPFSTPKIIQFNRILNFIDAGLSIDQISVERKAILDNIVLGALLSQIHQKLLVLLKSVILLMGGNVILKSKFICDILWKVLKRSGMGKTGNGRSLVALRMDCYDTLNLLMKISKNNIHIKNASEQLIQEILSDVVPPSDKIILTTNQNSQSSKKRKFTQKNLKEKPHTFKSSESIQNEIKLCKKALETLQIFLDSTGTFIKPIYHKILQDKVLLQSFNVLGQFKNRKDYYEDAECRIKLFEVLTALVNNSSANCPPPLGYGLEILTKAKQLDPDFEVRENCAKLLLVLEKAIHPKREIFYFPTDVKDFRDTIKFNQLVLKKFDNLNGEVHENGKKTGNEESSSEEYESSTSDEETEEQENGEKVNEMETQDGETEDKKIEEKSEEPTIAISSDEAMGEHISITSEETEEIDEVPSKKLKPNEAAEIEPEEDIKNISIESENLESETSDLNEYLNNSNASRASQNSKNHKEVDNKDEDDLLKDFAADFVDDLNKDL